MNLIFFDHDGTLCNTNQNAYDSLIFAAKEAAKIIGIEVDEFTIDWNKVFAETAGTTEKNYIYQVSSYYNIPQLKFNKFEELFYQSRVNWYRNMKSHDEYIYDTYYPDAEVLIDNLAQDKNNILRLLTGNPTSTIKERISNSMRGRFLNSDRELLGYFGELTFTRSDLINYAIKDISIIFPNFTIENRDGFIKNVCYVADTKADLFACLKSQIKVVWIPSRKIQDIVKIQSDEALEYIIKSNPNQILLTNNLESKSVIDFILS